MFDYKQFIWEVKQSKNLEIKKPKTQAEQQAYWSNIDKKKDEK